MKIILIALGCLILLTISPLVAADPPPKPLPVDQRLREIDLAIALRQYEKLQTELSEVRLMMFVNEFDAQVGDDKAGAERRKGNEAVGKRRQALEIYTHQLREEIRQLGGEPPAPKAK